MGRPVTLDEVGLLFKSTPPGKRFLLNFLCAAEEGHIDTNNGQLRSLLSRWLQRAVSVAPSSDAAGVRQLLGDLQALLRQEGLCPIRAQGQQPPDRKGTRLQPRH